MTAASQGRPDRTAPAGVLAVALLAAGAVAWAAIPMQGAAEGARLALIGGAGCAGASVVRLAVAIVAERPGTRLSVAGDHLPPGAYLPLAAQALQRLWLVFRAVPWAQGMTLGVLALEALHHSRPWHTVVLGVVLLGYLLALHLAESAARWAVLLPQLPLIVGGVCLAALSVGAAMLPATGSRAGAGWLSVLAAVAAITVAALALPV